MTYAFTDLAQTAACYGRLHGAGGGLSPVAAAGSARGAARGLVADFEGELAGGGRMAGPRDHPAMLDVSETARADGAHAQRGAGA